MDTSKKIVVLIDAENIGAKYAEQIIKKVAFYGTPVVRRAYGNGNTFSTDWKKEILFKFAIEPIFHPQHTAGKNVSDIALVIDAMDLLHRGQEHYDAFCIASNDSDFAGLAMRLRESSMTVYGLGNDKAIESFVAACDEFVRLEPLPDTAKNQPKILSQGKGTAVEQRLNKLLLEAVDAHADDDGWALLSTVGAWLKRIDPGFSPSLYGSKGLKDLVKQSGLFDYREQEGGRNVIRLKANDPG